MALVWVRNDLDMQLFGPEGLEIFALGGVI